MAKPDLRGPAVSVLMIVVPLALVLVAAAIAAYVWSVRRGQFDDLTTPAIRAIQDDEGTTKAEE
jgi:cbb3-type cytochrome oxidase maturation protein